MSSSARQAFVGVGANLGDRWGTICAALDALTREPGICALEKSAVFETAPVGIVDQPAFLNLVIGLETMLTPEELIAVLHARERAAGREREREVRWGPRPLDLDLLLFENETRAEPGLTLPHPRMEERSFVLAPLKELVERSPRFQRPAWTELRARLQAMKISSDGLKPWKTDLSSRSAVL